MPDELPEEPVIGDGIVTLPNGENEMSLDLPTGIGTVIMAETGGNIQANNRDGRNIGSLAAGVLQAAMARNFDELGTIESRANSGVIATPVASPTVSST